MPMAETNSNTRVHDPIVEVSRNLADLRRISADNGLEAVQSHSLFQSSGLGTSAVNFG